MESSSTELYRANRWRIPDLQHDLGVGRAAEKPDRDGAGTWHVGSNDSVGISCRGRAVRPAGNSGWAGLGTCAGGWRGGVDGAYSDDALCRQPAGRDCVPPMGFRGCWPSRHRSVNARGLAACTGSLVCDTGRSDGEGQGRVCGRGHAKRVGDTSCSAWRLSGSTVLRASLGQAPLRGIRGSCVPDWSGCNSRAVRRSSLPSACNRSCAALARGGADAGRANPVAISQAHVGNRCSDGSCNSHDGQRRDHGWQPA